MITRIINFFKDLFFRTSLDKLSNNTNNISYDNVISSANSQNETFLPGAFKDIPDKRDYIKEIDAGVDKKCVNLLEGIKFKPTYQGSTSACTGHAMAAFLSILYSKLDKENILKFNPYYIYYWNRMLAYGTIEHDRGCYLRETMQAVQKHGALTNELCSLNSVYKKPKESEINKAHLLNIKNYFRLPSDRIYDAFVYTLVRERLPILTALYIKRIEWDTAKKTGILDKILSIQDFSGGHAVCVYGYDKSDDTFLAINSWGELWGNKGHFKITRKALESNIMDAWTVEYNYF